MKNSILIAIIFAPLKSVFSQIKEVTFNPATYVMPDSVPIANGTKISKEEFIKICEVAWNASFGKMNNEEKKSLEGVEICVSIPTEEDSIEPEK